MEKRAELGTMLEVAEMGKTFSEVYFKILNVYIFEEF